MKGRLANHDLKVVGYWVPEGASDGFFADEVVPELAMLAGG
jgi:hypothetical protein